VAFHRRRSLVNSIHLWSVELFFFVMVVHLWAKYWMPAWRGARARVWITGVRDISRWLPLYRPIWRDQYRSLEPPRAVETGVVTSVRPGRQ
jgi:hypothetical protein